MVDGLSGLRHHRVISCNDDNRKVRQLCTTGTHSCEGFVSRGIEEGDTAAVLKSDIVGTYVLGDSTGFTCNHIGLADIVEKGGLTVVNVTHHGNDRRTGNEILFAVLLLFEFFGNLGSDKLNLIAELFGNKHESLGIETLVDGNHKTKTHTSSDNLHHRGVVHKGSEVVYGYEFGHFEDLVLRSLLHHLILGLECGSLSLLLAVLGSEVVLLVFIHLGIGLLDLLLDLLLHLLLLSFSQDWMEIAVILTLLLIFLSGILSSLLVILLRIRPVVSGILTGLCQIDFLLGDSLPLLVRRLLVKLAQIDLTHHLEASALTACLFCRGRNRYDRSFDDFRFVLLLYDFLLFLHYFRGFFLHLFWLSFLHFLFLLLLKFLFHFHFHFFHCLHLCFLFLLYLHFFHRLLNRKVFHRYSFLDCIVNFRSRTGEGVSLDGNHLFGFLFLHVLLWFLHSVLGQLNIDLLSCLFVLKILSESLGKRSHQLRSLFHLRIRIKLHLNSLFIKEIHQVLKTDIIFFY